MSEGASYLLGLALIMAVFLILMYLFQERHWLLKYLFIMGILLAGWMVPTAMYDIRSHCETVVANSTVLDASTSSYEYKQVCFTTTSTTPDTFYKIYAWVYFFMILYFLFNIFYDLYQYVKTIRWWP